MELSEWREELAGAVREAVIDWNTLGTRKTTADVSAHLADALLASPAMARLLAEVRAEAWRDSRLDLAYELRESGAWSEVRIATWIEMRADRPALDRTTAHPTDDHAGEAK